VRWDDRIQPGRDIDRIAAHIDILPTLAALAGARLPAGQVTGCSLLPLIEKNGTGWKDRFLFTHKGRWKTGADPDDHQWKGFAVRNQRFRFVDNSALYDMQADPGQTTNVIDQHPAVVKEMQAAYEAWWQKTRPMMVNEDVPMSPTRPFHVWYEKQMNSTGIPEWKEPDL
jgi:arylsulfatase